MGSSIANEPETGIQEHSIIWIPTAVWEGASVLAPVNGSLFRLFIYYLHPRPHIVAPPIRECDKFFSEYIEMAVSFRVGGGKKKVYIRIYTWWVVHLHNVE